ncbi:MAG: hypothetical protein J7M19_06485, partial [Planctomycetes bacterium]|nr:hypothetical protein [Planctomycetota bacterium]
MGKAVTRQELIGAAEALGVDLRHAQHVERDCRFLFSRTSHLTGLTSTAEAPLRVAAMLLGAPAGGPSGDRRRCRARLAARGRSSSPGGGRGRASLAGFLKGRFPHLAAPERRI